MTANATEMTISITKGATGTRTTKGTTTTGTIETIGAETFTATQTSSKPIGFTREYFVTISIPIVSNPSVRKYHLTMGNHYASKEESRGFVTKIARCIMDRSANQTQHFASSSPTTTFLSKLVSSCISLITTRFRQRGRLNLG